MLLIGATGFARGLGRSPRSRPPPRPLIAARAAMGVFGAMLMPSTLSLLRSIFTDRDQRRLAIAIWASGFSAGSALGPIVGGMLLEHFAWGSVFLLAVPVLVPLLVLVPMLVPESRDPRPGRIDVAEHRAVARGDGADRLRHQGARGPTASTGFGVQALVLGVVSAACCSCAGSCAARDAHARHALFRRGTFSGAVLVNLLSVIALVGFLYFVAQHLQLIVGLSPDGGRPRARARTGRDDRRPASLVVPIARRVAPRDRRARWRSSFSVVGYLADRASPRAPESIAPIVIALRAARRRHRRGRDGLERADPLERAAREGRRRAAPCPRRRTSSAPCSARRSSAGILAALYRANLVLPAVCPAAQADAARETLAGAVTRRRRPARSDRGRRSRDAAAHAFDAGVVVTALIGAGLMLAAAIIAAIALRNPAPVRSR